MAHFHKKLILIVILHIFTIVPIAAQKTSTDVNATIDPASQAFIIENIDEANRHQIIANDEILNLLKPTLEDLDSNKRRTGKTVYRVQVFSDNHGEKSRTEGEKKKRAVQRRFPDYPISLGWDSPYWKVKVGIFQSQSDAQEAANQIKRAFPSFSREIHVIRDRVKTQN